MYVLNYVYKDEKGLVDFIQKNGLNNKNNLLLQIFSGVIDKKFLKKLTEFLTKHMPQVKIIGTTTDGEIVNAKVKIKSVVLSFSVFEKTEIRVKLYKKDGDDKLTGKRIDNDIKDDTKAVIIFSDGLFTNGECLLSTIKKDVIIAGGFAGDNSNFKTTYVFTGENITDKGCAVAFLDNIDLIVNHGYNLNWEGIGNVFTVTKARKNKVCKLNNIPIKEIYKKYFGNLTEKYLLEIGIEFPLIVLRDDILIARAVLGEDKDCLIYGGNLYEGEKVQFGYASINDILIQNLKMLRKLNNKPIEGIYIYECVARRRFFNKKIEYEYVPINEMPTAGFFTYGEFFGKEKKYFFNQTMTYITFSESKEAKTFVKKPDMDNESDLLVCKALTNLIKSSSMDLRGAVNKFKSLAHTDRLTGILNREGCLEKVSQLSVPYTLLLIDIDHFKEINDTYGHDVGDSVLKSLVNLISKNIREEDIFCRFGGEEFLIFLPETSYENGIKIAEKLRKLVENSNFGNVKFTISIGVSDSNDEFKMSFKKADNNLYKAKRSGRNKVGF